MMIRFSNDEITVTKNIADTSAYVFVADRERRAGTNVADISKRSLKSSARRIVAIAKASQPSDVYAPLPEGPFGYDPGLLDPPLVSLYPKDLVSYVQSAIEAGKKEGAQRMAGSLIARNGKVTIQTSADAFASAKKSTLELSVRAFGNGLASGHSTSISASEKEFDPRSAGEEAGRFAKLAADPVDGSPGDYPAVLGPLVFADLACQCGRLASAFYVDIGFSFLADKIGQNVASEKFSIADDAAMPGTYGSFPVDAEGLPTKHTPIIEKGVMRTYLHNSTTAKKFGVKSTGNAGLISPHPFNLVVEPGDATLDDMIRSVDSGIYVTNDWYLRYQNYRTGDFSVIPRDAMFLIKNGEVEKSIRELRISDNMIRIFSNISRLSRERKWVKWWEVEVPTLSPSALVEGLKFTKSSM